MCLRTGTSFSDVSKSEPLSRRELGKGLWGTGDRSEILGASALANSGEAGISCASTETVGKLVE